jgi:hypothetical protein
MEGDTRYFYRRFMDDVIVLAKTRWHLRKAVMTVNQHFHQLTVAAKTVEKHVLHYRQNFMSN